MTIFEALHVAGGVLKYGIPEFRLPDMIIDHEIENLQQAGRGDPARHASSASSSPSRSCMSEMGYDAVFVGTGAGSPKFMGIPGEAFNGVFSANEFLTRVNLMRGHRQPIYDTPVGMGKRVAVVGAGNTAMDACARVAAHGRGIGHGGLPAVAARIARARRGTGARHRRRRRVQVAHRPGGDPGRRLRAG